MERILKVETTLPQRSFKAKNQRGETETVTAAGIILTNGADTFYLEGYREVCKKITEEVHEGDLVSARFTSDVRKRTTETGEFYSNTLVLQGITVLVKNAF